MYSADFVEAHPQLATLSDVEIIVSLQSDTSGSNPVWIALHEIVAEPLKRSIRGSATIADRDDFVSDALEAIFKFVQRGGITDAVVEDVRSIGVRGWCFGEGWRRAVRALEQRMASAVGISWERVYLPGKKINRLTASGELTIEEAAAKVKIEGVALTVAKAQEALDGYHAAHSLATIRIGDDPEEPGVEYPDVVPSVEDTLSEGERGLNDLFRAFGNILGAEEIEALTASANDDNPDRFRVAAQRARRRIKQIAATREDVLALVRGYEVAA